MINEGFISTKLGLIGIPKAAEEVIVARDIQLAEFTKSRLHIAHISSSYSVELVRQAKKRGVNVTAEVTPHHLVLDESLVDGFDTNTKVNPPLRGEEDRIALLEGLNDGTIDCIASDHAPTREPIKKSNLTSRVWNGRAGDIGFCYFDETGPS